MTYKIGLVACSAAKLDHAAPARELYTSQLFRKASKLAELMCDEWFILSAEHGLVHPDTILEPYDTKLTAGTARAWAGPTRAQLEAELNRGGAFELVVLAGKNYRTAVEGLPCDVVVPMQGLGIGQQLAYLTAQLQQGRYDCSCGWTMIYPGWEASEAWEEIGDHQLMHMDEDERL